MDKNAWVLIVEDSGGDENEVYRIDGTREDAVAAVNNQVEALEKGIIGEDTPEYTLTEADNPEKYRRCVVYSNYHVDITAIPFYTIQPYGMIDIDAY